MLRIVRLCLLILVFVLVSACQGRASDTYKVIYAMDAPDPVSQGGSGQPLNAHPYKIGIVPKVADLDYFSRVKEGAQEAAWDLNVDLLYEGPASADPEQQIKVIRDLMDKQVDALAVSANDPEQLAPVLEEARGRGIKVITWDSDTVPDAREFFVNMVDPQTLGRHLMDTLAWSMGEKGEFAIMTGALSAANLNEWLKWIKVQQQENYPDMKLVEVIADDDDPDKAYGAAKQLLTVHPSLMGIVGNSSVGPPAAAQAVKEAGKTGKVSVVGLSMPKAMKSYLHEGSAQVATLWSPKKLGYLTVVLARNLLMGMQPYDDQTIANVGNIRVDGDTVIMGEPLDFTKDNVDQYDF